MTKTKLLYLKKITNSKRYKVTKTVDTLTPEVGTYLSDKEVQDLYINNPDFKVTIVA